MRSQFELFVQNETAPASSQPPAAAVHPDAHEVPLAVWARVRAVLEDGPEVWHQPQAEGE